VTVLICQVVIENDDELFGELLAKDATLCEKASIVVYRKANMVLPNSP
jgi:hypothetical protein